MFNPLGTGRAISGEIDEMSSTCKGIALAAGLICAAAGAGVDAQTSATELTIIQWFEQPWVGMERRAADMFLVGYDGIWTPPASLAASPNSAGYNLFDRFNLGTPTQRTAFGTEQELRAAFREVQNAGARVFIDALFNHNSQRDASRGFQQAGGWPGFWMGPLDTGFFGGKFPDGNWGDFHNGYNSGGNRGYFHSENPGGAFYDLERGDLVALVDIAQESNHQFIRHPVDPADSRNIPAGSIHNRPNPENRRLYPDRQLSPTTFTNEGQSFTIYPFNTADPMAGDPITENATGLLMRWAQWMLEDVGVDGFRLDASKHTPTWFWRTYFDAAVHNRWRRPDGVLATPYSFGENVADNGFILGNQFRRDGFADRDALDINGSGQLRSLVNGAGLGTWDAVLFSGGGHLDFSDDGFHNGSAGVNHTHSHDNGTNGDGGTRPGLPTLRQQGFFANAYVLLRRGPAIIYHNARGVNRATFDFWPREGISLALGWDPQANAPDDRVARLVDIRREYARGDMQFLNSTDPVNSSIADVLVFERRTPGGSGQGNLLVAVNDRYDAGVQVRSVRTGFPAGTRLHELTGAAGDSLIDPDNQIAPVLVVDSNQRVLITVPNNTSRLGEHHHGYVAYGPAVPTQSVQFTNVSGTIAADASTLPLDRRRMTSVPVISADTFEIQVTTARTDALDPNTDSRAFFMFNEGFFDANGNGQIDIPSGNADVAGVGFERFLTVNRPLAFFPGDGVGTYRQVISTRVLPEGYNYLKVRAVRLRGSGQDPLFSEERRVVYIDRLPPDASFVSLPASVTNTDQVQVNVRLNDRTGRTVFIVPNVAPGADLAPFAVLNNQATQLDRFEFRRTLAGLRHGFNDVVAIVREDSGRLGELRGTVFVDRCIADTDDDGDADIFDILGFFTQFAAGLDLTDDGRADIFDILAFFNAFGSAACE